jgi:hypothetical protein
MVVLRYAYVVALVVWVGGLVAAGAFVAPAIFGTLEAEAGPTGRILAGAAFGEVLRRVLVAGEVAGVVMLVTLTALRLLGPKPIGYGVRAAVLAARLAATASPAHVLLPVAEGLRRAIQAPMAALPEADPRRSRFDRLHQLSTALVTGIALAGVAVAAWEARE